MTLFIGCLILDEVRDICRSPASTQLTDKDLPMGVTSPNYPSLYRPYQFCRVSVCITFQQTRNWYSIRMKPSMVNSDPRLQTPPAQTHRSICLGSLTSFSSFQFPFLQWLNFYSALRFTLLWQCFPVDEVQLVMQHENSYLKLPSPYLQCNDHWCKIENWSI